MIQTVATKGADILIYCQNAIEADTAIGTMVHDANKKVVITDIVNLENRPM